MEKISLPVGKLILLPLAMLVATSFLYIIFQALAIIDFVFNNNFFLNFYQMTSSVSSTPPQVKAPTSSQPLQASNSQPFVFDEIKERFGEDKLIKSPHKRQYRVLELIGKGATSQIYKVICINDNTLFAVKIVTVKEELKQSLPPKKLEIENSLIQKIALKELKTLGKLREKKEIDPKSVSHILLPFEVFEQGKSGDLCFVFPLMWGSLRDLTESLRKAGKRGFSIPALKTSAFQLLQALKSVHKEGIAHADIKLENILKASDPSKIELYLGDFGAAIREGKATEYIQTRWYRAPEVIFKAKKMTTAMDMWGLGLVLFELYRGYPLLPGASQGEMALIMFNLLWEPGEQCWSEFQVLSPTETGEFPFGANPEELARNIEGFGSHRTSEIFIGETLIERLKSAAPIGENEESNDYEQLIHFIAGMLTWRPQDRLTAEEALKHPFIAQKSPATRPRDSSSKEESTAKRRKE